MNNKTNPPKFWYAYRSDRAIEMGMGSSYYLLDDGVTKVACTALFLSQDNVEKDYLWNDKVYVGKVTRYLGEHTPIADQYKPWKFIEDTTFEHFGRFRFRFEY